MFWASCIMMHRNSLCRGCRQVGKIDDVRGYGSYSDFGLLPSDIFVLALIIVVPSQTYLWNITRFKK